jgi:hypothetical protein
MRAAVTTCTSASRPAAEANHTFPAIVEENTAVTIDV